MKRITLISDTHGYLGSDVISHLEDADEIWHAGDIGTIDVLDQLKELDKQLRVVFGNIDDKEMQRLTPLDELFECHGLRVFMTHIGGYPGRYNKRIKSILRKERPDLYICGHSHILKVMPDKELSLIHMNPGACGIIGFHKYRTIIKFSIIDKKLKDVSVVELGLRSDISLQS